MQKNNKLNNKNTLKVLIITVFILITALTFKIYTINQPTYNNTNNTAIQNEINIPKYSGSLYIELNNNIPKFEEQDFSNEFKSYFSDIDEKGRAGMAFAKLGKDKMAGVNDSRKDISKLNITGWINNSYPGIVEDNGAGLHFNVFVYNVQPGIEINYSTGENRLTE